MSMDQAILLVEDNDDDAELTAKAFENARIKNPLVRVRDGVEALDYLFGRNAFTGRNVSDLPAVVLLDLNLPRVDGLTVLKTIRADERIKHLPIVVLTSSNEDKDRLAAYDHFANSYVQKPVDYEHFVTASKDLGLYWLVLNRPAPARQGVRT
jgi:two-component system, response regulator